MGATPWRFKSSHPHSSPEQGFRARHPLGDGRSAAKRVRFRVAAFVLGVEEAAQVVLAVGQNVPVVPSIWATDVPMMRAR